MIGSIRIKLEKLAAVRGEVMSVMVREAVYDFIRAHSGEIPQDPPRKRKRANKNNPQSVPS